MKEVTYAEAIKQASHRLAIGSNDVGAGAPVVQSEQPVPEGRNVHQRKLCACGCGGLATKWAIRGHHWRATAHARFFAKITVGDGCWEWQGPLDNGYGTFGSIPAHRYAYKMLVGPIPFGLDIDHLCRNRACVRPDHLEPVTRRVNLLRGVGFPAINAAKKECPHGHEYDASNTQNWRGGRFCRECKRLYDHQRYLDRGRRGR
jgi:hypothetical protein